MEVRKEVPQKTKNRYSSSTPAYLPKEDKNTLEKPHTPTFIRDSLIPQSVKNLPAVQETLVLIPGWERLRGNGNGNPRLKNPMDREAWWATVHAVTRVGHDLATKPPPSPFIAALFITVATWKQPECPLADRQMKKMWHLHTYRSIHTQEILLGHRRGEPRTTRPLPERVTLSGTSQRGTAWSHFPVDTKDPPPGEESGGCQRW